MPKSTVEEEQPYKLPEDTYFPALLESVVEKSYPIKTGKRAGETFTKWVWEFKITEGDYAGLHASCDTDPKVTVTPDGNRNMPAMIVEALRDMEVSFGESIDTDDYLSLPCVITVRHTARDRTDGQGKFYEEPVKDVYPARILAELATAGHAEEPPF